MTRHSYEIGHDVDTLLEMLSPDNYSSPELVSKHCDIFDALINDLINTFVVHIGCTDVIWGNEDPYSRCIVSLQIKLPDDPNEPEDLDAARAYQDCLWIEIVPSQLIFLAFATSMPNAVDFGARFTEVVRGLGEAVAKAKGVKLVAVVPWTAQNEPFAVFGPAYEGQSNEPDFNCLKGALWTNPETAVASVEAKVEKITHADHLETIWRSNQHSQAFWIIWDKLTLKRMPTISNMLGRPIGCAGPTIFDTFRYRN